MSTTRGGAGLRGFGVEVPEDQRTSTPSGVKDLDDDRAYVVLPLLGWLLRPLRPVGRPARAACDRCGPGRGRRVVDGHGGVRTGRDGLPDVRGRRARPRPGQRGPDRRAVGGPAGAGRVAQAAVGVPRRGMYEALVRGARRRHRPTAGPAHGPGVSVGHRPAAARARLRPGPGPSARHDVEHRVDHDQASARGGGRGPRPVRGGDHAWGRRARVAPRVDQADPGWREEGRRS